MAIGLSLKYALYKFIYGHIHLKLSYFYLNRKFWLYMYINKSFCSSYNNSLTLCPNDKEVRNAPIDFGVYRSNVKVTVKYCLSTGRVKVSNSLGVVPVHSHSKEC